MLGLTGHVCEGQKEMLGADSTRMRKAEGDAWADGTRMRKAKGDVKH